MLIPITSSRDNAMSITYKDIVNKRIEMQNLIEMRKAKLQKDAQTLVSAYENSLQLPDTMWIDKTGKNQYYVTVGRFDNAGFQQAPMASFRLNERRELVFHLSTVVGSDINGERCVFEVSMWYQEDILYVEVEDPAYRLTVASPTAPSGFHQITELIKMLMMNNFSDPNLT